MVNTMEQASRIALLQQMAIFGGIRADILAFLLSQSGEVAVRSGEYFFREGDQGDAVYVLETGKVAVLKTAGGRGHLLSYLSAGDCFGEMALLDMSPRSASVHAVEDCTAIKIDGGSLLRVYEKDPEQFVLIEMNLARELSRRLRATDDRLFRGG